MGERHITAISSASWRTARPAAPGQYVKEGATILTLVKTFPLRLRVGQDMLGDPLPRDSRLMREFVVEGIQTTIPLHQQIFNTQAFIEGKVDTTFIERTFLHPTGK